VSGDRLPPPRFRPRHIARRASLKPQHRIVLGLVAMSAASLMLTLLAPPPASSRVEGAAVGPVQTVPPVAAEPTPGTTPGARVELPVPGSRAEGRVDEGGIGPRAEAFSRALGVCAAEPGGFAPADGRLEVVVELGPGGLEGAWLDGLSTLATDASTCLAAALGSGPWPTAEPPVAVRVAFFVVQPRGPQDPASPRP